MFIRFENNNLFNFTNMFLILFLFVLVGCEGMDVTDQVINLVVDRDESLDDDTIEVQVTVNRNFDLDQLQDVVDSTIVGGLPRVTTVLVDPRPATTLSLRQEFSLTFDKGVTAASVNGAQATGSGRHWIASPALLEGTVFLHVGWTNRDGTPGVEAVGPYVVRNPDVVRDVTPPLITSSTVRDGERNVDPADVHREGIRVTFDKAITGSMKLTDEAGTDLNWIGWVDGQTAALDVIAGRELDYETTYKIEIDV